MRSSSNLSTSNIFNAANKLKEYSVTVAGLKLAKEVIISLEMAYSNKTPRVIGELVFKDMYDMNLQVDWKGASVSVMYMDLYDKILNKEFRVLDVRESLTENNEKSITLELQDLFSFTLEKSYLPKSFTKDIIAAFDEYLVELGIKPYPNHTFDFSSSSHNNSFTTPYNMTNLHWFENELIRYGYVLYQTKDKICLKTYDDLIPSKFPPNDPGKPYKDGTDNQLYKNKIYELIPKHVQLKKTPPITRIYAYDIKSKKIQFNEHNTISDLILNDDTANIQETVGKIDVYQTHLNFDENKLRMREKFMSQYEIEIIVNGYFKNDLNQIYDLDLRGFKGSIESTNKGNMILGGKWVSSKVVDKIIGDSLIQKITLNRADAVKKK